MPWYLNPFAIRRAACDVRRVASGGGPSELRLTGVSKPKGWIFPRSRVTLEVVGKDGTTTSFEPDFPIPHPIAWSYRLGRKLGVPVLSDFDPSELDLGLFRRSGSGSRSAAE